MFKLYVYDSSKYANANIAYLADSLTVIDIAKTFTELVHVMELVDKHIAYHHKYAFREVITLNGVEICTLSTKREFWELCIYTTENGVV